MLRYLLMPQPSPAQHAKHNAKAKTQHQAHTNAQHPSQDGPGSFGFGKGIGSCPTLDDHCHALAFDQGLGLRNGGLAAQGGKCVAQLIARKIPALTE